MPAGVHRKIVRFGVFEVDLAAAELRKQGLRIRLQDQPFQVLAALLERPGEVVTRDELIGRLWADGTNVDYDRSLNAAVNRLRQTLSDSADTPRYIETLARRGYRFIAAVDKVVDEPPLAARRPPRLLGSRTGMIFGLSGVIVAVLAGAWWMTRARSSISELPLRIIPLTTSPGKERNPSFSPDGEQIVYEWDPKGGERCHIYLKVVGPADPVALTSGEAVEHGPVWSPDGRLIAFLRESGGPAMGVFVIPPVGGIERRIAEIAVPPYWALRRYLRRLDWTRDSQHLIVSAPEQPGGSEGLLLISINNGEKTWLTKPSAESGFGDREPSVAPDGRTVAFARGQMGADEMIYLLRLTPDLTPAGSPRPLLRTGRARGPAWLPDGKHLIYTGLNPGMTFESGASIIALNPGDQPRALPALGRNVATLAVSRTGRVAYPRVRFESNIWRLEVTRSGRPVAPPERLLPSSAADANAQYSPDGRFVAFASNRSGTREIWTCASDGSHCSPVTSFNGQFVSGTPRWSPDGQQIVFDSAAAGQIDIYAISANGGPVRRITTDATHGIIPSWSRNGKWIYFASSVSGRNEVWKIPAGGGAAVQVTRSGGLVAFESPDGRSLYYTKVDVTGGADLWRSQLDGSKESRVLQGVINRAFAVTPTSVYYLSHASEASAALRRFVLASGGDSKLIEVPGAVYLGLTVSPDEKYVAYSRNQVESNLILVENLRD